MSSFARGLEVGAVAGLAFFAIQQILAAIRRRLVLRRVRRYRRVGDEETSIVRALRRIHARNR